MKVKKILCTAIVIMLALALFISPALAEEQATRKNETVYGILDYDGSVKNVYVVNQLIDDYVDYGSYTEIRNLSSDSVPVVDGDKITFPDSEILGGLYYQGTMDAQLPMTFDISYYLDGEKIAADELGGSSGHLRIEIDYAVNEACDERLTDGIIAQIMLTLNMDIASDIDYFEGTGVIVGNTMNITYLSMLKESGTAQLEANVADFEMEAISISLLKGAFSLGEYENTLDDFKEGFDDMQEGAGELVEGTTELQGGITSLVGGVKRLSGGMKDLVSAGEQIKQGNGEYASGLSEFTGGVSALSGGSDEILAGLNELSANGSAVSSGVSDAANALSGLSASSGDLAALAQSLSGSADPNVQALAAGILETLGAVDAISTGLSTASAGLSEYTQGVSDAAAGYSVFNDGVQQLSSGAPEIYTGFEQLDSGFSSYLIGVKKTSSGLRSLYNSIDELPDDIQLLVDGQMDFQEGLITASDELKSETEILEADDSVVSFASPDRNKPDSVQYVLITPAIELPEVEVKAAAAEENENFFTRLADLFRKE